MSTEIELKLSLSDTQTSRLAAHPALEGPKPQRYRLFNTYYDTPALDLYRRGIALRLRRKGETEWLMTVKGGDPAAGALAERSEWEAPTQPGVLDFEIVTDDGLRDFLKSHQADLRPVFSTDFARTAWTVARFGALVEVALDRGQIDAVSLKDGATQASEPICELELELIEGGSPDALFGLAIELASDIPLHPAVASKAERGYALAGEGMASPAKAARSSVRRGMSPVEAFRSIALSCLLQLQRNEKGAIAGQDPEYVHQARVAIRRLRSCFGVFAPVLASAFIETYAWRWGELARQLGGARDWDVFLTETVAPLEEAFPGDRDLARLREKSAAIQASAQDSASVALTGRPYSELVLAFAAALFRVEPPTIESADAGSASLTKFAAQRLQKRLGTIRKIARKSVLDDMERHRLRIAFKKLRYALEFFAPLLPAKRLKRFHKRVVKVQDLLGRFNDQITAERLIGELHADDGDVLLTSGWIAGRKQLLADALSADLSRFLKLRKPW